jgi:uncharacterized protein YkwD
MNATHTIKLTAAALAASAFLSACGGGGGGNSTAAAGGASAPAVPPSAASGVAIQTSVPTPTYAADSYQFAAFNLINGYRSAMGVGMLKQDPILDTAGQAQALYLFSNLKAKTIAALDHIEIAGNVNYYGDSPLSRAQKAGAPLTEYVGENVAAGAAQPTNAAAAADCVGQALASVYHLSALVGNPETVGLGYVPGDAAYPIYICTTELGTSTGVTGSPISGYSYAGGQLLPAGKIVSSPYANETGVALGMRAESPNPAPDVATPGRPIMVKVNSSNADTLNVSQFTLTDSAGATVAARILVPAPAQSGSTAQTVSDPNSLLPNGTAVLLPLAPLKANTTYAVTFTGARDSAAVSASWNFTTAAN